MRRPNLVPKVNVLALPAPALSAFGHLAGAIDLSKQQLETISDYPMVKRELVSVKGEGNKLVGGPCAV